MNQYAIKTWGGSITYIVEAASSTEAKKILCKKLGRPLSAPLIGVRGMKAKKINL